MKKSHLTVIIPVLNLWGMTAECLRSLKECTRGNFYEVLVVDNGSTDRTPADCPDLGRELFGERFTYVRLENNINFGPACNLGASNASGEFLFFLNNDTLLTRGWCEPLLEVFRTDSRAVAASPLCLFPDNGRVQYLGIGYTGSLGVCHPYFLFPGDHAVLRRRRRPQALSAAALMIPARSFRDLGGFFPEYANGFEDMDLCCRIRRAGGRLAQENRSVVLHWASKTPGRNRFDRENMRLINERCAGCFKPDLHRFAREDGFRCELTPWLEMVMCEDPAVLKALSGVSSEDEIRSVLDAHPLWVDGYDKASYLFAEQGRIEEAAEMLFYGSHHFPEPGRLERLSVLAGEAGKEEWAAHATAKLAGIQLALSSFEVLMERAENVRDWALDNSDAELAGMYEGWMNDSRNLD